MFSRRNLYSAALVVLTATFGLLVGIQSQETPKIGIRASKSQKLKSVTAVTGEDAATANLRQLIENGGEVIVPPGRYTFLDTLVVSRTTSIKGAYRDLCIFDFSKMVDPTKEAIRIDRMWGYELSNITITGNRTTNSLGILNSTTIPNANGTYGTVSGSAIWSHIIVSGFKTGIQIGSPTQYIAASENVYTHLEVAQCDTCIKLYDYNTLNHRFIMLLMGDCNTGMTTNGASYVSVDSGSFSSVKGIVFDMAACSASRFRDCRMEEGNVFLRCGTTSTATNHIVDGCQIHQRASLGATPPEDTSLYANGWQSPFVVGGSAVLTVRNTFISMTTKNFSPILDVHNAPGGAIEATGNTCNIDPSIRPFKSVNNSHLTGRWFIQRNQWTNSGQIFKGWYPDSSN